MGRILQPSHKYRSEVAHDEWAYVFQVLYNGYLHVEGVIAVDYHKALFQVKEAFRHEPDLMNADWLNTAVAKMKPAAIEYEPEYRSNRFVMVEGTFAFLQGMLFTTYPDNEYAVMQCKKDWFKDHWCATIYGDMHNIYPYPIVK